MKGLFGDMFEFNHDGNLDSIEQAAEYDFFNRQTDLDKSDEHGRDFVRTNLDTDELSMMDDDERREALEDVGLDPNDYE